MHRGTKRRLWTWIPLFSAFIIVWLVLSMESVQAFLTLRGAPPIAAAPAKDAMVLPPDVRFTCLDGEALTGADLIGRPAVITVFATWCPPCMAELPSLQRLRTAAGDTATVLMVGLDGADSLRRWAIAHDGDLSAVLAHHHARRRGADRSTCVLNADRGGGSDGQHTAPRRLAHCGLLRIARAPSGRGRRGWDRRREARFRGLTRAGPRRPKGGTRPGSHWLRRRSFVRLSTDARC